MYHLGTFINKTFTLSKKKLYELEKEGIMSQKQELQSEDSRNTGNKLEMEVDSEMVERWK